MLFIDIEYTKSTYTINSLEASLCNRLPKDRWADRIHQTLELLALQIVNGGQRRVHDILLKTGLSCKLATDLFHRVDRSPLSPQCRTVQTSSGIRLPSAANYSSRTRSFCHAAATSRSPRQRRQSCPPAARPFLQSYVINIENCMCIYSHHRSRTGSCRTSQWSDASPLWWRPVNCAQRCWWSSTWRGWRLRAVILFSSVDAIRRFAVERKTDKSWGRYKTTNVWSGPRSALDQSLTSIATTEYDGGIASDVDAILVGRTQSWTGEV